MAKVNRGRGPCEYGGPAAFAIATRRSWRQQYRHGISGRSEKDSPMKNAVSAAVAALLAASSHAEVVTINPSGDATLHEAFPNNNVGANDFIVAGTSGFALPTTQLARTRALIKFDLAGRVPAGATITRARVTVTVVTAPSQTGSMFSLSKALAPWTEGRGVGPSGQSAQIDEVTWNSRVAGSSSWQVAGALGASDVAQTESATAPINQVGSYTFESAGLISDIQSWLAAPANNFGWVLWGQSAAARSGRQFASREADIGRPVLEITYTAAPPELRITSIAVANGQATLTWTGGRAPFRIERRAAIDALPEVLPAEIAENTASIPLSGMQSFYRIVGSN